MKICILGNSRVFIEIIKKILPSGSIEIVAWRSPSKPLAFFDMIFLCGFDHQIYTKTFRDCIYDGYLSQFSYVKKLITINKSIKIIYINSNTTSKVAISRYDFIKNRLAYKLAKLANVSQIMPKFIIGEDGNPLNSKGKVHTFGVKAFRFLKIIDTCYPADLEKDLAAALNQDLYDMQKTAVSIPKLKPLFVQCRRTFLVDKFLKSLLLLMRY